MATRWITFISTLLCSISLIYGQTSNCAVDLVFVMDTSDGAMNNNAGQPMRDFMSNVAGRLRTGSNVALVSYGSTAETTMNWQRAQQATGTLSSVNLRRMSATNTHLALNMARNDLFANVPSPSSNNPKFAILVSEGPKANNKLPDYRRACQDLKNQNVRVMVIGVLVNTQQDDYRELNCHYDNNYVKFVNRFSDLQTMTTEAFNLINGMCGGTPSDPCLTNPCRNNGVCSNVGGVASCRCTASWTGPTCSQPVTTQDPCNPNPCRNGQCYPSGSSPSCSCNSGWTGTFCDQRVGVQDPCLSNPCRNGGRCNNYQSSYTCDCSSGWTGYNCDQYQDACLSNPCTNGQCQQTTSGYNCNCYSGWSGPRCDQTTGTQCTSSSCMNGGTCYPSGTSYFCSCPNGFSGNRCEMRDDQTVTPANEVYLSRFESNDRFGEMRNENGGKDQLDWQTTTGRRKPMFGPMKDASEDSTQGNYAYIMVDRNTDYMGKSARYMTQPIQSTGAMCLEFKYWMTGGWDKLRVLVQRSNGQVVGLSEFKSNDDYKMWIRGQVTLEEPNPGFTIVFEAYPYYDYSLGTNMIALDDVAVLDGGICAPKPAVEGYYYRIVGGPSPFEGRVEVSRYNTTDPNMWGGLCNNGFGTLEAQLLCAKLFPGAEQLLGFRPGRTISLGTYGNPSKMVQDNINCYGQVSLEACSASGWMETGCLLSESAKVRCDQPEFYYVGNELRLADYILDENAKTFSGRVELFYNGQWGTVCSNGFDQNDAQAVCNTIGFMGPARVNANGGNGQGTGPVYLENVNCPRDAPEFTACLAGQSWTSSCQHFQDVGVTCTFQPKNIPWTCTLENNNNCGFFPYSMNDFEWVVGRPPVGSPHGGNSVMYAKLSPDNRGSVTSVDRKYDMSIWISPMFEAFPTTDFLCVRFWYYPYDIRDVSSTDNVFAVYVKMGRNSYPKFWIDARDIGVNRRWTEAYFTLTDVSAPFKLKVVAKQLVPAGRQSYILLDDFRITEGSCTGEGYIMGPGGSGPMPPGPTPGPIPGPIPGPGGNCGNIVTKSQNVFVCGFDDGSDQMCSSITMLGSTNSEVLDWTRTTGATPSVGTGPTDGNGGNGYLHLEASNVGDGVTAAARINSRLSNNMDYCISFDYHMMGENIDKLRVGFSTSNNYDRNNENMNIYELDGEKGDQWNLEMVDVMTRNMGSGYLFVSARRGNGYQGDIAIDNLKLREGKCCPNVCANDLRGSQSLNIYNCAFEGNFEGCCFRNCPDRAPLDNQNRAYQASCGNLDRSDSYVQWIRVQGNTRRENRNYPADGSNKRDGFYLASGGGESDERSSTSTARLFTGMIDLRGGSVCLRMRANFWPANTNGATLSVGIVGNSQPIRSVTRSSNRDDDWRDESFTITGSSMVQLYIDGKQTGNQQILIDNINLSNGRC